MGTYFEELQASGAQEREPGAACGIALNIKRLDLDLPLPSYAYPGDAGLDLYSAEDVELAPLERRFVACGISIAIPQGYVGLVVPRSGLAYRSGLSMANTPGIVDSQYRGEIKAVAVNLDADKPIIIKRGDRIAQLVILAYPQVSLIEVDDLDSTERGSGGFGSSGS